MGFTPLAGIENRRTVWAWGMFDLANQSFTLLINTLLYALFFREVVVADASIDDTLWSVAVAASLGIVVVLSPVLGAIADARALKKEILMGLGLLCAALTCGLGLVPGGGTIGAIAVGIALYIPANVAYQLGENFLASFLPEITTRKTMGRVSGFGWSMGYLGALVLLALTFVLMEVFGLQEKSSWRPLFVFAGVWFLVMMTPTALFLHEKKRPERATVSRGIATEGFRRLASTVRRAGEFRHLARFLVSFLVYGFGVQVVIFFATPIAEGFGIVGTGLVLFVAQITVVAGITAMVVSRFQDRIGHRRTVEIFLLIWAVNAIGLAFLALVRASGGGEDAGVPTWPIWVVGNGLGIGLGGIGTSSRTMVGVFTPAHRTAEFFGLWGLTYKLAGLIGVLSFGVMRDAMGPVWALALLASFFIAGFVILMTVNEGEGIRAAEEAERVYEYE